MIESDLALVLNVRHTIPVWLNSKFSRLDGFPILPEQTRQVSKLLNQEFKPWANRCIETANQIIENKVNLLGHEVHLEDPPSWHKDHISGTAWPAQHPAQLRKLRMNHGSDIKFVWELSRFHHGVVLGRAFALTGDEKFASKFVTLLYDWLKVNPVYVGPNWLCAMEVAVRAVNLLWTGALLASSQAFDVAARKAFVKALLTHGTFLYHNLEYREQVVNHSLEPVNGNHYLADLAGLLHVSCAFPECCFSSKWREFAQNELFREVRSQVDKEGVHREYSPGYHRLVLEMVLGCLILLERQGVVVPVDVRRRTLRMVDFISYYRKPSGGVPLVRDIDNGRFCILGEEGLASHDHLLALGAIYFNRPDLYPGNLYEDCFWHLGPAAYEWHLQKSSSRVSLENSITARAVGSRLFGESGFALMRNDSHYLLALCCPKGSYGYCGHTHNDFLSFELEAHGRTFLTDCGSYVYTQNREWRNRFRSTLSHNTVAIDGQEQNEFHPTELFEIESQARPEVKGWTSNRDRDILDSAYVLTLLDGTQVTHERRFVFLKHRSVWLIRDRINGTGAHAIETRFHFAEGVEISAAKLGFETSKFCYAFRTLCVPAPNLFLIALGENSLASQIEPGWVSRTYAKKTEIRVLRLSCSTQLPFEEWYIMSPTLGGLNVHECPFTGFEDILQMAIRS